MINMKSVFYILLLIVGFQVRLMAQVYDKPCFSLNSHPTLEIMSIEIWEDQTVVNIKVKNQWISGSFCFDKETFLVNSLGS